jgi:hypothetical protein
MGGRRQLVAAGRPVMTKDIGEFRVFAIPRSSLRRWRSDPLRTRSLIAAVALRSCGDPITAFRRSVISVYTTH